MTTKRAFIPSAFRPYVRGSELATKATPVAPIDLAKSEVRRSYLKSFLDRSAQTDQMTLDFAANLLSEIFSKSGVVKNHV